MSRSRFFMYAFVGMFCYAWFPGYLFERLSIFNWLSWISPSNVNLAAITTFDWNMVTTALDPLVVPLLATLNVFAGAIVSGVLIAIFWFTNIYWASYLPINTNRLFNRWGTAYNVSEILDSHALLDQARYEQYSTAFLAPSSLVRYAFFFATYSATISYSIFYHGQAIMAGFRNLVRKTGGVTASATDIHSRLMRTYKEGDHAISKQLADTQVANRLLHPVSEIWYAALNVLALTLAVVIITAWPTSVSCCHNASLDSNY
jgi:hypothetical protein